MKYLIMSAVCLWHLLLLPSGFAQNPNSTPARRTIILDVFVVDLKNQTTEDLETLSKDRAKFNKALADGKIKIISSNRIRCLSGEANQLRIGQRIPIQSGGSTQAQYENSGFNLSVSLNLTTERLVEAKYSLDWSATIPNYLQAQPAFIQRQLSGITKLTLNELTPIIDSLQSEPLWKATNPAGPEKSNESTGNFVVIFSGKVID